MEVFCVCQWLRLPIMLSLTGSQKLLSMLSIAAAINAALLILLAINVIKQSRFYSFRQAALQDLLTLLLGMSSLADIKESLQCQAYCSGQACFANSGMLLK